MNAVEIRNLTKSFGQKRALDGLNMAVPQGSVYGFIGENGSGKSTAEKLICGLLVPDGGEIKIFGKDCRDAAVRKSIGVLIESPGCFPSYSVWNNMMLQAANLGIKNPREEVCRALKLVRMEGAASNKFKNCSLGMKQRIGIAMALLGGPALLVLDEPINGLDADGMRIMRDVLKDVTERGGTAIVSSHILGELEKTATHYGILRGGRLLKEMTAKQLADECPEFALLRTRDNATASAVLERRYGKVTEAEEYLRVYGADAGEVAAYLFAEVGIAPVELKQSKVGLEEYYAEILREAR